MQTLVYHAGALGDFLTILPMLRHWRQRMGGSITLLGRRSHGELALGNDLIDELWDVESAEAASFFASGSLPPAVAHRLRQMDTALVLAADSSPVLSSLQRAGIKRIRHQAPFSTGGRHIVDYHLSLLEDLGEPYLLEMPLLMPQPDLAQEAASLLPITPATVFLHAGSGSVSKNWPLPRFLALADQLKGDGLRTVWLHGPAEPDRSYPPGDPVLRNIRLPVLVHLLASCRLYIGNDSGISHLAAACGASGVLLFGASDHGIWAPRGKQLTIVTARPSVCTPCHPHTTADLSRCGQRCLTAIPVEAVITACRDRMNGKS